MHKRDRIYFMNPGPGGPEFGGPPDFGGGPFFKMRVPGPGGPGGGVLQCSKSSPLGDDGTFRFIRPS